MIFSLHTSLTGYEPRQYLMPKPTKDLISTKMDMIKTLYTNVDKSLGKISFLNDISSKTGMPKPLITVIPFGIKTTVIAAVVISIVM